MHYTFKLNRKWFGVNHAQMDITHRCVYRLIAVESPWIKQAKWSTFKCIHCESNVRWRWRRSRTPTPRYANAIRMSLYSQLRPIHCNSVLCLTLLFYGTPIEIHNKTLWLDSLDLHIGLTTLCNQTTLSGDFFLLVLFLVLNISYRDGNLKK